jgi:16S rRNA (guanine527-N7)-methyltransferase
LFERHVTDSLRAVRVLRAEDREAVDAGSGAGLPGVPVAIARPDVSVRLVEARRGRAAFLELVVERLRLPNVEVLPTRVEDLDISVDVVFARAFAPAAVAWSRLSRLLRPGGHLVYFAGDRSEDLDVVGPASLERVDDAVLATSGPLIIMTR